FFSNTTPPPPPHPLSLHDALPIFSPPRRGTAYAHSILSARRREPAAALADGPLPYGLIARGVIPSCIAATQQGHDAVSDFAHFRDRKSTRLNSSHLVISYAVFCLK